MKYILQILAILFPILCFSQQNLISIDNWKSLTIESIQDSLNSYNRYAKDHWNVIIKDRNIYATNMEISNNPPFKVLLSEKEEFFFEGRKIILKVDSGYLIAFNRGEWGGALYWFSNDGKMHYEISEHSIVQFIKRGDRIFAIEGLAHMGISIGGIIEITKEENSWTSVEFLKLPYAPEAASLDSTNNFVIITTDNLLSVDSNANIKTLISEGFWAYYLNPSSMAIKNNIAYIGMINGIFKYNLETGKQEWLMKD
jgi:hypothetical protein